MPYTNKSFGKWFMGIGLLLIIYVSGLTVWFYDNLGDTSFKKSLLEDNLKPWRYVESSLKLKHSRVETENIYIANKIRGGIRNCYNDSIRSIDSAFCKLPRGGASEITSLVKNSIEGYDDKIVLYRRNNSLGLIAVSDNFSSSVSNSNINKSKNKLLNNFVPDIPSSTYLIFNKNNQEISIDSVKYILSKEDYSAASLDGLKSYYPTYIDWKRGIGGISTDDSLNHKAIQIIILSEINLTRSIMEDPSNFKLIGTYGDIKKKIETDNNANSIISTIFIFINIVIVLMVGIFLIILKDSLRFKREGIVEFHD